MAAVISLAIPVVGYNEAVVQALEDLMVEARAGTLTSIMAICQHTDGTISNTYTGTDDLIQQAGMCVRMQHRIMLRMDDGEF